MVLAWERQGRTGIGNLYTGIGTLMTVAIGTTISGFAGMLFTTHPGIRSIGSFAVVGLVCCLAASLAVVPWLCSALLPPNSRTHLEGPE
jgi:predicted exporter